MKVRKLNENLNGCEVVHSWDDLPTMFTIFRGAIVVGVSLYNENEIDDNTDDYYFFDIKTMGGFPYKDGMVYHYCMAISKDDMMSTM